MPRFSDSPNARSKSITSAELDTHGVLNRHSKHHPGFQVGVSEDKGSRRTMEDAHSFVVDFDDIRGQGFFAVFDGHAGKHAAEWCGTHFHESLLTCLHATPLTPIPDILNRTFHKVDESLSLLCEESEGRIHSGCTAVTAFLRVEDRDGQQAFRNQSPVTGSINTLNVDGGSSHNSSNESVGVVSDEDGKGIKNKKERKSSGSSRIKQALKSLGNGSITGLMSPANSRSQSPAGIRKRSMDELGLVVPPSSSKRVLYTANAGDARGVLCRAGKAIRLTYDHKGSDKQEAKRITDAGGFVMSGRVNGVLAVTRSLGDSSMKEFVVGAPYTTETTLCEDDEFLILACDGLWDVTSDQAAIELVREIQDAQTASHKLLRHALAHHTTDNVTVLVIRFKHPISQA